MKATKQKQDDGAEVGTFVAAKAGEQAYQSQQAHDTGEPIFGFAENVIANNASGGAGYFAEAHHTASLNIDANYRGLEASAERVGSTAFGSPDIIVDGVQYNPKFYQSADASFKAGATMLGEGADVTAKYAGQTIIVPSDQLEEVQQQYSQAIAQAQAEGNLAKLHALESIQYADHIDHGGAQSIPLSYADAQEGADVIRSGDLPGYVGEDSTFLGNGAEGALLAASFALATAIAPQLIGDVGNAVRGKLSVEELTKRLQQNLGDKQVQTAAAWALSRGGAAAAMTAVDSIDPFGASLVVNVLIDAVKLILSVQRGQLTPEQFGTKLLEQSKSRFGYTSLTAGAFWVVGPLGLLVPIIVKRIVQDNKAQRQTLDVWKQTGKVFRAEFESRIRSVALLNEIGQHYRNAEASVKASATASKGISQDVAQIIKLMNYRASSPKPAEV